MRFLGGFLTGFVTMLLVIIIVFCCLFLAVPVSTYAGWFGVELDNSATMSNASIVEFGTELVNTVGGITEKSLTDIKGTFGLDVFAILKTKLGIAPENTAFDHLATCKLSQISTEIQKVHVKDILDVAKVTFDDNTKEMITPLLDKSILEITATASTAISDVINGIKVANIKAIDPNILPNIPLFNETSNDKVFVDLFSDLSKVKVNQIIDVAKEGIDPVLKAIADCTLMEDPAYVPTLEFPKDPNFVGNKIVSIPIADIIPVQPTDSVLIKKIKEKTINDLKKSDVFNSITIGEIAGTSTSNIILALRDVTVGQLTGAEGDPGNIIKDKINKLKLTDVLTIAPDSLLNKLKVDVKDAEGNVVGHDIPLVNRPIGSISVELKEAVGKLTLEDVLTIAPDSLLNKLTVTVANGDGTFTEVPLKQRPIDKISAEVQPSIGKLTLKDVITIESDSLLSKLFVDVPDGKGGTNKVALVDRPIDKISGELKTAVTQITIKDVITVPEDSLLNKLYVDVPEGLGGTTKVALVDRPIDKIGSEIKSAVDNVALKDVMSLKGTILEKVTVDVEGVQVPIGDRPVSKIGEDLKKAKLGQLITITPGSLLDKMGLADIAITDIDATIKSKMDTLLLKDVMDVSTTSLLYKMGLADTPINELSGKIDTAVKTLKLGDVITIPKDSLLDKMNLGNMTINDLSTGDTLKNSVNNLVLGDVMTIPDDSILGANKLDLANTPISNLNSAIDTKVKTLSITSIITPTPNSFLAKITEKYPNTTLENIDGNMQEIMKTSTIADLKSWKMFPDTVNINTDITKLVGADVEGHFNYIKDTSRKVTTLGECTIEQLIKLNEKAIQTVLDLQAQLEALKP